MKLQIDGNPDYGQLRVQLSDQIIMEFSGSGKLWVQSRNPRSLADFLFPFRPTKSKSGNDIGK